MSRTTVFRFWMPNEWNIFAWILFNVVVLRYSMASRTEGGGGKQKRNKGEKWEFQPNIDMSFTHTPWQTQRIFRRWRYLNLLSIFIRYNVSKFEGEGQSDAANMFMCGGTYSNKRIGKIWKKLLFMSHWYRYHSFLGSSDGDIPEMHSGFPYFLRVFFYSFQVFRSRWHTIVKTKDQQQR